MIGKTLSHYRVVEKVGAGGMGEVYRARDEHLGRDVALKVLPTGTLGDEHARKRFRKEAQALSKLNHPNIATVFDFDTQNGVDFLVMELVEGVTLSDKLAKGPLAEKEVVRLGGQVAEALEEAHERGVVHRDLKPGNVMVTAKGQVKVLDFGLAKLVRPDVASATATTESFTETQAAAGTLPYMAPEQLRGEQVDARTDIHALGAVLYEMATGQRAFPDRQPAQLTAAILQLPVSSPRALNRRVSVELERVVMKCLEKEPENRYQSAKEIAVDLRRLGTPGSAAAVLSARRPARRQRMVWAVGVALVALLAVLVGLNVAGLRDRLLGKGAPGQITSIAVLPLENMMGDSEQDYFVEGMHEALITNLSKIRALKVISRTSVMRYKETEKPIPEIAQELGVDVVVEGSVLRAGDQVRITAQLIDAATDEHLWAESYQRNLTNILDLQSEVAGAIVREIRVTLTRDEEARLATSRSVNPQAYEAYLKGRYHWNKFSGEGFLKAIEYFEEARNSDADYALAYAGLADCYLELGWFGHLAPEEAFPQAKAAATKALELDDMVAEAHASLANIRFAYDWDWKGAERSFERAIELNPGNPMTHQWYADYLMFAANRRNEALAEIRQAKELDPLSLLTNTTVGWYLYITGRYDQAIEQLQRTLELDPNFALARHNLGLVYLQQSRFVEAVAEFQEVASVYGSDPVHMASLGHAYGLIGRRGEALRIVQELEVRSKQAYTPSYYVAWVYAGLDQDEDTLRWLEKAFEEKASLVVLLRLDPLFNRVRSDPRFQSLLRRMNFPP